MNNLNTLLGEFEAGFESGGQTREHALLVRSEISSCQHNSRAKSHILIRMNHLTITYIPFSQQFLFKFDLKNDITDYFYSRSLGVSQLVIAVNKLDTVDWKETISCCFNVK